MNKLITLTRDGKTVKTLERQMAHDVQLSPGKKFKHGSGKMWTVTAVEDAPEYNPAISHDDRATDAPRGAIQYSAPRPSMHSGERFSDC